MTRPARWAARGGIAVLLLVIFFPPATHLLGWLRYAIGWWVTLWGAHPQ